MLIFNKYVKQLEVSLSPYPQMLIQHSLPCYSASGLPKKSCGTYLFHWVPVQGSNPDLSIKSLTGQL